jgi:two-component system, NtrC family, nitrogen regulation response regulator NtrX
MSHRILIVDDEAGIRQALKQVLEYEKLVVRVAASGGEAITLYPDFRPHLVFLDVKMAGLDGLETLTRLRDLDPKAQVVMISGHATIATAVEATQRGAFDFLEKPLDTDRLLVTVRNALAHAELIDENSRLREATESRFTMVGKSPALRTVRELIAKVGPTAARVLITGDNGTGKELVARALHEASPRRDRPFVEVNCAAIPSELIESELFGHMKGSFTGAVADRAGKFEQADGGTLFLDEVGDMSQPAQAKLLRVLQEGVVTRIGGSKSIQVDVRVLAATNKDLEIEIAEGRFREDLLYRLNVVPIDVPALRERKEDIPALVAYFAEQLAASAGVPGRKFADEAVRRLQARAWPGNIRELRNAVERALILASGKTVTAADIDQLVPSVTTATVETGGAHTFETFKQEAEKTFLTQQLRARDWNVSETARALKMPRSNLYKKIERYGLSREGGVAAVPVPATADDDDDGEEP